MDAEQIIPIRTSTLRPHLRLLFDVYVPWEGQHLKYRSISDVFEEDRLEKFISKGIRKVFIRKEDEPRYLEYLDSALDQLSQAEVSTESKAQFAKETLLSEAENVEKNLDTQEGYTKAQNRIDKVVKFLSTEAGALQSMLKASGVSLDNSQHSATVASVSLALAPRLGISDVDDLQSLGFACLLHDIGKAKLDIPYGLHPSQMTKEQLKVYHLHPAQAVDLLSGRKYITPKVLRMIIEHEEIGEGAGFPEKKQFRKLPLPSQVLNLCNDFDRYCQFVQKSNAEGFELFAEKRGELFDLNQLAVLEKVIKGM